MNGHRIVLGIDIGGTRIKGALVDVVTGAIQGEKRSVATPQPAHPEALARQISEITRHFNWTGPMGCGFPAAIRNGVACTAANIDPSCRGTNFERLFADWSGVSQVTVINDADAAGIAEMTFGSGAGNSGSVMILTAGTGIGSALFREGILFPNTELGHMPFRGQEAEDLASGAAFSRDNLTYPEWALRFNEYLGLLEYLFWPDLFIIGGGMSDNYEDFAALLDVQADILPATMHNDAGIVGAALHASRMCPIKEH